VIHKIPIMWSTSSFYMCKDLKEWSEAMSPKSLLLQGGAVIRDLITGAVWELSSIGLNLSQCLCSRADLLGAREMYVLYGSVGSGPLLLPSPFIHLAWCCILLPRCWVSQCCVVDWEGLGSPGSISLNRVMFLLFHLCGRKVFLFWTFSFDINHECW